MQLKNEMEQKEKMLDLSYKYKKNNIFHIIPSILFCVPQACAKF